MRRESTIGVLVAMSVACAAGAQAEPDEAPVTLLDALKASGFSLRRSFDGKGASQAALLSFTESFDEPDGGTDSTYTADFYLAWSPGDVWSASPERQRGELSRSLEPVLSVEGHLSSNDAQSEDAWRFRASLLYDESWKGDNPVLENALSLSLKHETDRDFGIAKTTAELLYLPSYSPWAMGHFIGTTTDADGRPVHPPLDPMWQPGFGIDFGYNSDAGDSMETDETILRLMGRVRGEILVDFEAYGIRQTTIFAENTFRYLPLEDGESEFNFFVAGVEFAFTDNFTLTVQYKNGEDTPKFERIETLGVAVGIKF